MKNPFRHHAHGTTLEHPPVPDTPAELLGDAAWHHAQHHVDHDCARDPGSDLYADWDLECAECAAEGRSADQPHRKHL